MSIYNLQSLTQETEACFICSTPEDAQAVYLAGGDVKGVEEIALDGESVNVLFDELEESQENGESLEGCQFIICLNDKTEQDKLVEGLNRLALYTQVENLNGQKESIEAVSKENQGSLIDRVEQALNRANSERTARKESEGTLLEFTSFYEEAHKHLNETTYHRGLTEETLNRFKIGYIEKWKDPRYPHSNKEPSPRLIIPTSETTYLARFAGETPEGEKKCYKVQGSPIFNLETLDAEDERPCFIVEGELDALSVEDVGEHAIGLGSLSNITNKLKKALREKRTSRTFIICLDNDSEGRKKVKELEDVLNSLELAYTTTNIAGDEKDANAALQNDREKFKKRVKQAAENPLLAETLSGDYTTEFLLKVVDEEANKKNRYPTGFKRLDRKLGGGLTSSLYCLGAVSGAGKTTLALQIASNIAETGQPVLYVSIEMSKDELTARNVSRQTYIQDPKFAISEGGLLDSSMDMDDDEDEDESGMLDGLRQEDIDSIKDDEERKNRQDKRNKIKGDRVHNFSQALGMLQENMFKNFIIYETEGAPTVEEIRQQILRITQLGGKKPVVFIDYLQLMSQPTPQERRLEIDKIVMGLKQLTRSEQIPIFVISSLNRQSNNGVNIKSGYKESGGIEYTSDVLLNLQYAKQGDDDFTEQDELKASEENSRDMKILISKNRRGKTGEVHFEYKSKYNYFKESREIRHDPNKSRY